MTEYTPGPWSTDGSWIKSPAKPYYVAEIIGGETEEEVEANAILMSAATDLLEALKEVAIWDSENFKLQDMPSSIREKINAAIAKAEGQS